MHATMDWSTDRVTVNQPGVSLIRNHIMDSGDEMKLFFSRPIKVGSYAANSTNTGLTWFSTYFTTPNVLAKLRNYYLGRYTYCVRAVSSIQGFIYGTSICAWYPAWNTTAKDRSRSATNFNLPHFLIEPHVTSHVEYKIPYFHYRTHTRESDPWALYAPSFNLMPVNPWQSATDATYNPANSQIEIYVWLEDVEINVPTLAYQSNEYKMDGVVSAPASWIANTASALANIPIIGPIAKATEIFAGGVASIATVFGFSRPTNVGDRMNMRSYRTSLMAVCEGNDNVAKLTVDPKQEKSLGSEFANTMDDQMAILWIAKRPSLVTTLAWNQAETYGTDLYTNTFMGVQPMWYDNLIYTTSTQRDLSNLAFATFPFRFWRGTIIYTVRAVAPQNCRGVLQILWVPSSATSTDPIENTSFSCMLDLSAQREVDVVVSYLHPQLWLQTQLAVDTNDDHNNGYLRIRVIQPLSMMNGSATVNLNIAMRAGDDFMVAVPESTQKLNLMHVQPYNSSAMPPAISCNDQVYGTPGPTLSYQSKVTFTQIPLTFQSNVIAVTPKLTACYINGRPKDNSKLAASLMGEVVGSFRQLIKRYVNTMVYVIPGSTTSAALAPQNGFCVSGVPEVQYCTAGETHYVNTTIAAYLMIGFSAFRGGMRYKCVFNTNRMWNVFRSYSAFFFGTTSAQTTTSTLTWNPANVWTDLSAGGMQSVSDEYFLEFEVPGYCTQGFYAENGVWVPNSVNKSQSGAIVQCCTATVADSTCYLFTACAEDWNCFEYTGPPFVYFYHI